MSTYDFYSIKNIQYIYSLYFGDLMKMDTHVLFLIVIIGIISVGIVGATVMSQDTSMKQEVFDGITISVPADSEFVKAGNGVYKDSNYGITINTFKNNNSMIDFLKNTKKSKIIPIDNQPPQSVAFKKGDTINILVTNGLEGVSIGSKDGELTSKMANNIIFSNNHKSDKSSGIPLVKPHMNIKQDFNLIMLLVADVDTNIFNLNLIENNLAVIVDDYNEQLELPTDIQTNDSEGYVSDIENNDDLNNVLTDSDNTTSSADGNVQSSDDEPVQATTLEDNSQATAANDGSVQASPEDNNVSPSNTNSNPASNFQQKLTFQECQDLVLRELINYTELTIDDNYEEVADGYVFTIVDNYTNTKYGEITVNALTGELEPDADLKQVLAM